MAKYKLIYLFLAISLIITGCASKKQTEETTGEQRAETTQESGDIPEQADERVVSGEEDVVFLSVEEMIESCNTIIEGTVTSVFYDNNEKILIVHNDEQIFGNNDAELIYVHIPLIDTYIDETDTSFVSGENDYIVDKSYVFLLEKKDSVFYTHPKYHISCNSFICTDNGKITSAVRYNGVEIEEFTGLSVAEFTTFSESVATLSDTDNTENDSVPYFVSDDTSEIVNNSEYVFNVRISELLSESSDRATYIASINSALKGKCSGRIYVVLPKEKVVIGNDYIIALNRVDTDSYVFVVSTLNSVFEATEEENITSLLS